MSLEVKLIQSGTASVVSGAVDITITAVTVAKTLVIAWPRASLTAHQNHLGKVTLSSTTNLSWRDYNLAQNYTIDWFVYEMTAGSDWNVIAGEVTINETAEDVTISSVGDTAKAFIVTTLNDTGTSLSQGQFHSNQLTSTTNLRYNTYTGTEHYAAYQVVYTTADFTVQEVAKSIANTDGDVTSTITSVTTSKSFVLGSGYPPGSYTVNGDDLRIVSLTDATTLTYDSYATGVAWDCITHVISLTAGTVQQDVNEITSGTTADVTTALVQARTMVFLGSCSYEFSASTEVGDDLGEFGVSPRWTSSTNVRLEKAISLDDSKTCLQLVEIPAAVAGGQPMMRRWGGVTGMGGLVSWQ